MGSSKGKTCGKGHKGQRARNKSSIPRGFEGGQTKFYKLLPKRGFSNKRHRIRDRADMVVLNLGVLQDYIDMGRFRKLNQREKEENDGTTTTVVTLGVTDFIEAGIFKKTPSLAGIKLLAKGKERYTAQHIRLEVNRASAEAVAAAETPIGGQVTTFHYNRLAMRAMIRPDKFHKIAPSVVASVSQHNKKAKSGTSTTSNSDDSNNNDDFYLLPKQSRPPPKFQPYYTSWKTRGYLCPQVQMRAFLNGRPELEEAFEAALSSLKIHDNDDNDVEKDQEQEDGDGDTEKDKEEEDVVNSKKDNKWK